MEELSFSGSSDASFSEDEGVSLPSLQTTGGIKKTNTFQRHQQSDEDSSLALSALTNNINSDNITSDISNPNENVGSEALNDFSSASYQIEQQRKNNRRQLRAGEKPQSSQNISKEITKSAIEKKPGRRRTTNIMILLIKAFHNEFFCPMIMPFKYNLLYACECYVSKYNQDEDNLDDPAKRDDYLQKSAIYRIQYMVSSYLQIRQNKLSTNPYLYNLQEWQPFLSEQERKFVAKMAELQRKDLWECFLSKSSEYAVSNFNCKKKFVDPVYEKLFEQKLLENSKRDIKRYRDTFVQIRVLEDFTSDPLLAAGNKCPIPQAYESAKRDTEISFIMSQQQQESSVQASLDSFSRNNNNSNSFESNNSSTTHFESTFNEGGSSLSVSSNVILFKKEGTYFVRFAAIEEALFQDKCELIQ